MWVPMHGAEWQRGAARRDGRRRLLIAPPSLVLSGHAASLTPY
jgi:hypothetical protein